MKQPSKILVPVDFSERSEIGVAYAAMLAASTGAELVVMTTLQAPEAETLDELAAVEHLSSAQATIAIEQTAEAEIRRVINTHAPDARTSTIVRSEGSPAETILDVASEEDVDLIVVASHGRSGMTRWLLGSVAEKTVRGSEVPVLVVPVRGDAPATSRAGASE